MSARSLSCPNCGAPLEISLQDTAIACGFCGSDIRITSDGRAIPFFERDVQARKSFDMDAVLRELAAGQKINAVRIVRDQTGMRLNDALAYVEGLEEQPSAAMPDQPGGHADLTEIRLMVQSGKKIEAIKRYREMMDTSLAEAKEAVEALARGEEPGFTPPPKSRREAEPDWPELLKMIRAGQKVEAARLYSARTGKSMEESLQAMDRLETGTRTGVNVAGWGCTRLVLGIVLFFILIFAGCGQFVRTTDLHACAVEKLSENRTIRDVLGQPIEVSPLVFVLGYSSESDFGGRSERSAGYFMTASGPQGRALFFVDAYENSTGFYGIEIAPIPNPNDFNLRSSGDISDCVRSP